MNPLGHHAYPMVKLEQEHRLARLEHRHRLADETADERTQQQRVNLASPRLSLPRRVSLAAATATALLAIVAGAALAFPG